MNVFGLRRIRSVFLVPHTIRAAVLCIFLLGVSGGSSAATPEEDWLARSTADGVVRAIRFDNEAEVQDYTHPDGGASNITFDSSIKASGNGSMRFLVPSNSGETSGSGSWRINFSDYPFDVQFGANSEFFVQWRQRFDSYFLEHKYLGGGGWKQIIFSQGDVPEVEANACSELELVVHNNKYWGMPQAYHSCGVFLPYHENDGNDWLLQNAANCQWRNGDPDPYDGDCVPYYADEFMTFQVRLKLGPWVENVPDPLNSNIPASGFYPSEFEMWVARDGAPPVLTHRFTEVLIRRGNEGDDPRNSSYTAKYGKIWLTTYNTGKDSSETHQEASTWYDEVIVSTKRIADPLTNVVSPEAPSALKAN